MLHGRNERANRRREKPIVVKVDDKVLAKEDETGEMAY